jgi:signal transduction histidine kinase
VSEASVLAEVAHEFKTPITSMGVTLELLLRNHERLRVDEMTMLLTRVQRGVFWLQSLVDNFLGTLSLDANALSLARQPLRLDDVVDDVVPVVQPFLSRKRQNLVVSGTGRGAFAHADRSRLGQVLLNLLVNASKYSPEGDEIHVRVSAARGRVSFQVSDHGIGISREDQRRIFEPFARGANAESHGSGLGLGLSIARSIVELHGGVLRVKSAPGRGSTFVVSLPQFEVSSRRAA